MIPSTHPWTCAAFNHPFLLLLHVQISSSIRFAFVVRNQSAGAWNRKPHPQLGGMDGARSSWYWSHQHDRWRQVSHPTQNPDDSAFNATHWICPATRSAYLMWAYIFDLFLRCFNCNNDNPPVLCSVWPGVASRGTPWVWCALSARGIIPCYWLCNPWLVTHSWWPTKWVTTNRTPNNNPLTNTSPLRDSGTRFTDWARPFAPICIDILAQTTFAL